MTVGVAHQYKIREAKARQKSNSLLGEYWKNLNLDLKNAVVKRIDRETAKRIILEYEWLGTMSTTSKHYGIYFDGVCGGVACYGNNCTANHNAPKEFGLEKKQFWTLARGACVHWTPVGAASKLIAQSLKLLKEDLPEARLVIAYSDTNAGEIGTVYQATNWYYIGDGCRKTVNYYNEQLGRKFDERQLDKLRKDMGCTRPEVRQMLKDSGWKIENKAIKHKYIFLLGSKKEKKEILKRITVRPYPKRDGGTPAKEVSRE